MSRLSIRRNLLAPALGLVLAGLSIDATAQSLRDGLESSLARALAPPFIRVATTGSFAIERPGLATTVTREGRIVHRHAGVEIAESFVGGRASPAPGATALPRVSRFVGAREDRWSAGAETYSTVELGEVWSGIRATLETRIDGVERVFVLAPGSRVDDIAIRLAGHDHLEIAESGALSIETRLGAWSLAKPKAWQDIDGVRREVAVRYQVSGSTYGFVLGDHDRSQPVFIDPLLRATYLASQGDMPFRVADLKLDGAGDVYVVASFWGTVDPALGVQANPSNPSQSDTLVAKLSADLSRVLAVAFLGGASSDDPARLLLANGSVYVTGTTTSSDFPTLNAAQPGIGDPKGDFDAFVARFDPALGTLLGATYLGGSGTDYGRAIAAGPDGTIYVVGETHSADLPATAGGALPANEGFVMRLSADLSRFLQGTFVGGNAGATPTALAVDPHGSVFVAGHTRSIALPGSATGAQPASRSPSFDGVRSDTPDAFVVKLDPSLTSLIRSTFFGAGLDDRASDIGVDPQGRIYLLGTSHAGPLPALAGAAYPASVAYGPAGFVARLSNDLTTVDRTTYVGPASSGVHAFAIEADGSLVVPVFGQLPIDAPPGVYVIGYFLRLDADLAIARQIAPLVIGYGNFEDWRITSGAGGVYLAATTTTKDLHATQGAPIPVVDPGKLAPTALVARFSPDLADTAAARGPELAVTPRTVQFGFVELGKSGPTVHLEVENTGQSPTRYLGHRFRLENPAYAVTSQTCMPGTLLAAGARCAIQLQHTGVRDMYAGAQLEIETEGAASGQSVAIKPANPSPPLTSGRRYVIEYYHPGLDHYFMTADADEIAALDRGAFFGWRRTGASIDLYDPHEPEYLRSPVCRYYLPVGHGDSHFYTASPFECAEVAAKFPAFILERSEAFRVRVPDAGTGECSDPVKVYRVWNRRPDTNHRYTTDRALRDRMVARGYVAEGYGPDAVAMCANEY